LASAEEANSASGWKSLAEVIASVGGATAVLTAFLLYFGHERASAFYDYYGVPLGALDLSPTDYLLDSPDSLFRPVVWGTVGALVVAFAAFILRGLRRAAVNGREESREKLRVLRGAARVLRRLPRRLRNALRPFMRVVCAMWLRPWYALDGLSFCVLSLAALAALGVGIQGVRGNAPAAGAAFSLALAAVLIVVLSLSRRVGKSSDAGPSTVVAVIGAVLLFAATFWLATVYARQLGASEASSGFYDLPEATIYAKNEVTLRGSVETRYSPGAQWKYHFPGYRLLQYANGRWFLTHKFKDPDHPNDPDKLETYVLPRDEANFVVQVTDSHFHTDSPPGYSP
jgi:hypothetical protein